MYIIQTKNTEIKQKREFYKINKQKKNRIM